MGSILKETKAALGLAEDAVGYDVELILFINSVLSDLVQLGIGPPEGFAITDDTATWADFIRVENPNTAAARAADDARLASVRIYMYLGVKMLFNPPQVGFVLTAYERLREEAAWRLTVKQDTISRPPDYVPPPDPIIYDGGVL